jgi:hypothetical protein
MARQTHLSPEFIELAPAELKDGILYISMVHSCVIHRCCCGCGEKVVTPLSPGEWQLYFDGEAISLHPSIGNSRMRCRSHYWIRQGRVLWAQTLSRTQTEAARKADREVRDGYFSARHIDQPLPAASPVAEKGSFWQRCWAGLLNRRK